MEEQDKAINKEKGKDENNSAPQDEEDSTPAPQIKIGPDGKIVLDEKSLVSNLRYY